MTDLQLETEQQLAYDVAQRASEPGACERWAHVVHTTDGPDRDPMLWPRDRGPITGVGYRVSTHIVRKGLWKICLSPEPALSGLLIDPDTHIAALRAYHGAAVTTLTAHQIDQIVQVGLFGEVLYR